VQARNGVISVFGDVKADEVLGWVESRLGRIPGGARSAAGFDAVTPGALADRWDLKLDKEQGVLVIGFPTVGLQHEDAAALHLIDEACSDMGSRLFNRIREELGLAYYVGTQAFHALGAGAFYFYVGTDPTKLEMVEAELMKEVAALASEGLGAEELERAKTTWKSSWLRQQQGNGAMADALGWDELNGFGFGHHRRLPELMQAVSIEQVLATTTKYFDPARAFVVTVRP
jgi:zinc protease